MSLSVIQGSLRCLTAPLVKAIRQDLEGAYGESLYLSTTLALPGGGQSQDICWRVSEFFRGDERSRRFGTVPRVMSYFAVPFPYQQLR